MKFKFMKKKLLQIWYKITCEHDLYMDKQINMLKCIKCGYTNRLLNSNTCNLFPTATSNCTRIEKELHSKTLFDETK